MSTAEIAKALVAFQAEMPAVAKTKTANVRSDKGNYSYTYAGLAEVASAALPVLSRHGLAFVCVPEIVEGKPVLTGVLLHTSGESLSGSLPLATGGTPQQTGSAITYGRRYLFGSMTGLITDDDDDGALASRKPRKKAERVSAPQEDQWIAPEGAEKPTLQMAAGTRGKMFALFGEHGITDEDQQRDGIAKIVGHPIASRGDLTEGEAQEVIKVLKARPKPDESTARTY